MDYITVAAPKPGQVIPRIDKRTADIRIFQIDCQPLLGDNELITGNIVPTVPEVLKVDEILPKLGRYIVFKLSGGQTDLPYADYTLSFLVVTTYDNQISVPVLVRVYST